MNDARIPRGTARHSLQRCLIRCLHRPAIHDVEVLQHDDKRGSVVPICHGEILHREAPVHSPTWPGHGDEPRAERLVIAADGIPDSVGCRCIPVLAADGREPRGLLPWSVPENRQVCALRKVVHNRSFRITIPHRQAIQ